MKIKKKYIKLTKPDIVNTNKLKAFLIFKKSYEKNNNN